MMRVTMSDLIIAILLHKAACTIHVAVAAHAHVDVPMQILIGLLNLGEFGLP